MPVNEVTLRRRLHRLGYSLQRCRSRNPQTLDYGTYRIWDPSCDGVVAGSWGVYNYGLKLPEVAEFVDEYRER